MANLTITIIVMVCFYTVAIPLANYLGNKTDEYFKARHKQ